jgi:malate/lactate dehydrogenase
MKLGIVGAGRVGTACALSLVTRGSAREIVIVDRQPAMSDDEKRALGRSAEVLRQALQRLS